MATTNLTTRGFTGQEEMDSICAVNLNARIYDPTLGKFLSADPIVGTPFDPQQLNRYTYVLNNPLSLTDPSGLCFLGCFWKSPIFRAVVAIAVVVVFQQYEILPEIGGSLGLTTASESLAAVVNGAVLGGVAGGIATGTLKGAALGALQGGLFAGVGDIIDPFGGTASQYLGSHTLDTLVSHGLVGGLVSVASGGNFGSGFLAAGIASFAPAPVANQPIEQTVGGTVESAVLGGFGSLLGGGKFQNGAVTGAFGYLFNEFAHQARLTAQCQHGNLGACTDAVKEQYGSSPMGASVGQFEASTVGAALVGATATIAGVTDLLAGTIRNVAGWLFDDSVVEGAATRISNVTAGGARYSNWELNMSPAEFESNITSSGYTVVSRGISNNGAYAVFSNGQKTYTLYTGTSTSNASVDVQIGGQTVSKLRLVP